MGDGYLRSAENVSRNVDRYKIECAVIGRGIAGWNWTTAKAAI